MQDEIKSTALWALLGAALGVGVALGLGLRMLATGAVAGLGAGAALGAAAGLRGRADEGPGQESPALH